MAIKAVEKELKIIPSVYFLAILSVKNGLKPFPFFSLSGNSSYEKRFETFSFFHSLAICPLKNGNKLVPFFHFLAIYDVKIELNHMPFHIFWPLKL